MKAIQHITSKNHLLRGLLIIVVIFLFVNILLYFLNIKNFESDRYDMMISCESVPSPVFTVAEGIYDQPFELEIYAPEDDDIFYTTDGSVPTVHSYQYKKPLMVDPQKNLNKKILTIPTSFNWKAPFGRQNHCVVFRARCFRNGVGYGKVKNMIYSTPDIQQHQGFQIVHILIEADSLFDHRRGIYVLGKKYYSKKEAVDFEDFPDHDRVHYPANYYQRGKNWRRPAAFILTDLSGKTLFEQNVFINVRGVVSRVLSEKSLQIMPDNLTDTVIRYSFFDELPYSSYKRLLLRNSGFDFYVSMFRDALIQRLSDGTGVDIQAYTPSVVYINGNYWGIHNIREKQDENYLAAKYDSSLPNIHILNKRDHEPLVVRYGSESSFNSFEQLLKFIHENSLADHDAYQVVCAQIDVDNFIDYMILETFFANCDWTNNNVKIYRFDQQTKFMKQQGIEAGKWRWLFFDLDDGMYQQYINMFETLRDVHAEEFVTQIFMGFMENADFKDTFISRYEYLVKNHLTSEKILEQINLFELRYKREIERQIARWRYPRNMHLWRTHIGYMRNFANERPAIVLEQLKAL